MSLLLKKLTELRHLPEQNDHGPQDNYGEGVSTAILVGPFSLWALGFTICIGNQFTVWNVGLTAGFASQLIALLLMGSAYICLRLCNTELESSFPFAGGAYGISRITLGLYPGFLIGCCEAAQFISYVADATFDLSRMLSDIFHKEDHLIPVFCLLFYMSVTCVLINGNRGFWKIGALLGMSSLLILLVFCFGSLPYINMARYTPYSGTTGSSSVEGRPQWFVGGMVGFMRYLPLAAWFYRGSGSLNLPGYIVSDSKTAFPMSSIYCILTQHFCSIFVLFVCASLPMMDDIPTAQIDAPLSVGFALMFKIPVIEARAFTIPALCVTVYGSIFAFSRILLSMSQSGLISPLFKRTCSKHKAPYVAILAGSALCYGLFLIAHFLPPIRDYLPLVCILFEISGSIGQFIGYVIFKRKYGHYAKDFSSPLGIWGAYYGGFVISLGAVAICVFQSDFAVLINTMGTLFFCSIYYFTIAKRRQVFSEKEKVFFPMQVIKFNIQAKLSAKIRAKKARSGPATLNFILSPSIRKPNPASVLTPLDLSLTLSPKKTRILPSPLSPAVGNESSASNENDRDESCLSTV